jgi:hypothetical protein
MSIYTSKRISRVKLILQKWVDRYGKTSLDDLGKDVSIQSEPDNVSYHVKGHE